MLYRNGSYILSICIVETYSYTNCKRNLTEIRAVMKKNLEQDTSTGLRKISFACHVHDKLTSACTLFTRRDWTRPSIMMQQQEQRRVVLTGPASIEEVDNGAVQWVNGF